MIRRLLGVAVVAAGILALGVPQVFAETRPTTSYYLALGDSLAAGFQPDPTISRDEGYVGQVYEALKATRFQDLALENLGCDGATTTTLLSGGGGCAYPDGGSQLDAAEQFLRDHPGLVRLVTIDIGGNDINRCAAGGTIDQACAVAAVGTITANVTQIMSRLRAAAPGVRIVGMTYYDPYLAAWLTGPAGQAVAVQSVQLTTLLNENLAGVYSGPVVRVADVAAAFSTTDLTTPAPGVGTVPLAVARICEWTWMCVPGRAPDIHPNSTGYQVIADTFLARVTG